MCDYSLQTAKSRPAIVGERLQIHNFGCSTRGFKSADDAGVGSDATAICVLPGTEIAFDAPVKRATLTPSEYGSIYADRNSIVELKSTVAIFRQMDKEHALTHHDAIELADDHDTVLITHLIEGQTARVLQLPAVPQSAVEAKEQERLIVVG